MDWWLVPGVTLPSPHDSWVTLQQTPVTLSAGGRGYRKWMDRVCFIFILSNPFFVRLLFCTLGDLFNPPKEVSKTIKSILKTKQQNAARKWKLKKKMKTCWFSSRMDHGWRHTFWTSTLCVCVIKVQDYSVCLNCKTENNFRNKSASTWVIVTYSLFFSWRSRAASEGPHCLHWELQPDSIAARFLLSPQEKLPEVSLERKCLLPPNKGLNHERNQTVMEGRRFLPGLRPPPLPACYL